MAEPRLSPTELDRLEDALEDLEFAEHIDDPSSQVAARLADYQLILSASRDAFPLQEVPDGALRGVLQEAGMSLGDISAPVTPAAPARPGLWARFRKRLLVPTLAVAGSAALVLLMVRPSVGDRATASGSAPTAKGDNAAAGADADAPPAPPEQVSAPAPAAPPVSAAEPPADAADDLLPPSSAVTKTRSSSSSKAPGGAAAPEPAVAAEREPEPEPEPEPKKANAKSADRSALEEDKSSELARSGWDAVERGDKARSGGDCFTARNHYARALDDGNDSVRARAYAGLGLCKEKDGDDAAAEEYFERARELDPEADDYAGTQQSERKAKPSPKRPNRKSRSKKRKMDALDPFG